VGEGEVEVSGGSGEGGGAASSAAADEAPRATSPVPRSLTAPGLESREVRGAGGKTGVNAIKLHVYDLPNVSNELVYQLGLGGIYHVGVEVNGVE
jgi:hypothetical protein